MSLRSIAIAQSYRTGSADIAAQFFVPCLGQATTYDRATGYFSSNILQRLLPGLEIFISRDGRIRLIASPFLSADDIAQLEQGYLDKSFAVTQAASDVIADLRASDKTAFLRIAWLVANDVLDVKLAVPKRLVQGIYHEKFGVFSDDRDAIAFTGSLNETLAALEGNFEYIDVFTSWNDRNRVDEKVRIFDTLWNGTTTGLDVFDFPTACREQLLREAPREYPSSTSEIQETPTRVLKDHQSRALEHWVANSRRGILEMATGTGKTFTALNAAKSMLREGSIRTLIVLVPYIHIAEQWRAEIVDVLCANPIVCHSQETWRASLETTVLLSKYGNEPIVVVALYETASSAEFQRLASAFPEATLLIADEVHNINPDMAAKVLLDQYQYRLGLSATPERYMDTVGTDVLLSYFSGIVERFSLKDAIETGILSPYEYHPIVCSPTDAGDSSLSVVNAAKLRKFCDIYPQTDAFGLGFSLVYCQPQQVAEALEFVGKTSRRSVHTFTAEENRDERIQLLRDFGSGALHALVAIRCLDEGVDIPPTRSAFLLGSSENPKQFVQRRGRVLRKYPGKTVADIYDFVYLPPQTNATNEAELDKEMTRFAEFALAAENADEAFATIAEAASARGMKIDRLRLQPV